MISSRVIRIARTWVVIAYSFIRSVTQVQINMNLLCHGQIFKTCMFYINKILPAVALVISCFLLIHSQGSHIYMCVLCVCAHVRVFVWMHYRFISLSCVPFRGYIISFIHLAWEILHHSWFVCVGIYNRHCSWTFKLFPYWCYCEQCFHEHWSVDVYFHFCEYVISNRMARLHHNCTISMESNHQLFFRATPPLCINTSDWVLQNFQTVLIASYCLFNVSYWNGYDNIFTRVFFPFVYAD